MIKEVPSKVFNRGLDRWLERSLGIDNYESNDECSYCYEYCPNDELVPITFKSCAENCPLAYSKALTSNCCFGLYKKWLDAYNDERVKEAMKLANKIVDLIIDRCVYEDNQ